MKDKIIKNSKVTKEFQYSKGEVSLAFSLRMDASKQLQDFAKILEEALSDVKKELN